MEDKINDTPPLAELLLDEFMHRINNELAALIAIVSRVQAMNRDDATSLRPRARPDTARNVGRVQHALHGPRGDTDIDASEYLRELCESRRSTLENTDMYFVGRAVSIDAARCRRLGMIVCELVENARKHALSDAGRVSALSISIRVRACQHRCSLSTQRSTCRCSRASSDGSHTVHGDIRKRQIPFQMGCTQPDIHEPCLDALEGAELGCVVAIHCLYFATMAIKRRARYCVNT